MTTTRSPDDSARSESNETRSRFHWLYRTVVSTSIPAVLRAASSGARVFCFHNVVSAQEASCGDSSLHMEVGRFAKLLEWLSTAYQIIPLEELVDRLDRSPGGGAARGLAAVTFDDAYEGFFEHALPIMASMGIPGTVFVVSRAPDSSKAFWWDQLAAAGRLDAESRERHLQTHRGVAVEILAQGGWGEVDGGGHLPRALHPASWDRLREAVDRHGSILSVGSHTATHPNLVRATDQELTLEFTESRNEINEAVGTAVHVVSYPYGIHDCRVRRIATRAGYRAGLTLDSGPLRPGIDPMALGRLNVPADIDVYALECWAVGLAPPRR